MSKSQDYGDVSARNTTRSPNDCNAKAKNRNAKKHGQR